MGSCWTEFGRAPNSSGFFSPRLENILHYPVNISIFMGLTGNHAKVPWICPSESINSWIGPPGAVCKPFFYLFCIHYLLFISHMRLSPHGYPSKLSLAGPALQAKQPERWQATWVLARVENCSLALWWAKPPPGKRLQVLLQLPAKLESGDIKSQ